MALIVYWLKVVHKERLFYYFLGSFYKSFLKKKILSAFKKTSLQLREYNYIVKVVTQQPLEENKHSFKLLVLLNFKIRVIRKLIKNIVDQSMNKKTCKLVNTVEALTV